MGGEQHSVEPTNGGLKDSTQQGNRYNLSGDFSQGIANVGSALSGITQTVNVNPTYIVQETPPLWAGGSVGLESCWPVIGTI